MDSLVHRIQLALHLIKRNIESEITNTTDSQVTRSQMFMLYTINHYGKCKLTQLADQMEVKPSAITVMIDRLEKSGYVKRSHCTLDRRSILVELTETGKDVLKNAVSKRNEILKGYVSRLNPEEVLLVAELLEKIAGTKQQ